MKTIVINGNYVLLLVVGFGFFKSFLDVNREEVYHATVKRIYWEQVKSGVGNRAVKTKLPRVETDKGTFTDNMNLVHWEWTVGGDAKDMRVGETYDIVTDLSGDILKAEKSSPQ